MEIKCYLHVILLLFVNMSYVYVCECNNIYKHILNHRYINPEAWGFCIYAEIVDFEKFLREYGYQSIVGFNYNERFKDISSNWSREEGKYLYINVLLYKV